MSDIENFLRWLAFNILVGNNDCHAKNLAFLHKGGKTSLAEHSASLAAQLKADHPQATIAPRIAALIDQRSRAFRWLPG